jgi:peptidyl-prolyl cis-trans isomerase A (cyclophilin A)
MRLPQLAALAIACAALSCQRSATTRQQDPRAADAAHDLEAPDSPSAALLSLRAPEPDALDALTQDLPGSGPLVATVHTSLGALRCTLAPERAPHAVTSFVALARGLTPWLDPSSGALTQRPFFDQAAVYRVFPDTLLQASPVAAKALAPGWSLPIEAGIDRAEPGLLLLARRGEYAAPGHLIITARALPELMGAHTAFGRCAPLSLIHRISRRPADPHDAPITPLVITTISIARRSTLAL